MAEKLPYPRALLENKTTIGKFLGVQERKVEDLPDNWRDTEPVYEKGQEKESHPGLEEPKSERRTEPPPPDVEELDLSHVPERFRKNFHQMLKKYSCM